MQPHHYPRARPRPEGKTHLRVQKDRSQKARMAMQESAFKGTVESGQALRRGSRDQIASRPDIIFEGRRAGAEGRQKSRRGSAPARGLAFDLGTDSALPPCATDREGPGH